MSSFSGVAVRSYDFPLVETVIVTEKSSNRFQGWNKMELPAEIIKFFLPSPYLEIPDGGNEKAIKAIWQFVSDGRQRTKKKLMLNEENPNGSQCTVNHFFICVNFFYLTSSSQRRRGEFLNQFLCEPFCFFSLKALNTKKTRWLRKIIDEMVAYCSGGNEQM